MLFDSLPPPTSGTFLECSFRRSLSNCEDIVSGDWKGREDLKSWQTSPFFHHCVETLQDQYAELSSSSANRISEETLKRYKKHVDAIAAQLLKPEFRLPPSTTGHKLLEDTSNIRNMSPQLINKPVRVPTLPTNSTEDGSGNKTEDVDEQLQGNESELTNQNITMLSRKDKLSPPIANTNPRLQMHANLQEHLTEELAGMAAALKHSTQLVEGKLKEQSQLLDGTETALDHSLHHTRKSAAQASKIHSK